MTLASIFAVLYLGSQACGQRYLTAIRFSPAYLRHRIKKHTHLLPGL